VQSDVGL